MQSSNSNLQERSIHTKYDYTSQLRHQYNTENTNKSRNSVKRSPIFKRRDSNTSNISTYSANKGFNNRNAVLNQEIMKYICEQINKITLEQFEKLTNDCFKMKENINILNLKLDKLIQQDKSKKEPSLVTTDQSEPSKYDNYKLLQFRQLQIAFEDLDKKVQQDLEILVEHQGHLSSDIKNIKEHFKQTQMNWEKQKQFNNQVELQFRKGSSKQIKMNNIAETIKFNNNCIKFENKMDKKYTMNIISNQNIKSKEQLEKKRNTLKTDKSLDLQNLQTLQLNRLDSSFNNYVSRDPSPANMGYIRDLVRNQTTQFMQHLTEEQSFTESIQSKRTITESDISIQMRKQEEVMRQQNNEILFQQGYQQQNM